MLATAVVLLLRVHSAILSSQTGDPALTYAFLPVLRPALRHGAAPALAVALIAAYVPLSGAQSSPSQSKTQAQSASQTPSQGLTPSQSPTQRVTPSQSVSITTTVSSTPSQTATQTTSPTITQTQTASQSASQGATPSATETPSTSATPSSTRTPTQSASLTASVTQTPSISASLTQTPSLSSSQTQTRTVTPSQTQSLTSSESASPSETVTPSQSPTTTGTPSGTGTPSSTESPSQTRTSSQTTTASESQSSSLTESPSLTETPSITQTQSPSQTQTASTTQTQSQSPSTSATPSVSETPSQTRTQSATPSATGSASVSQTPSQTPSETQTPSLSTTLSPSPRAVAVLLGPLPASSFSSAAGFLALSDSLAPVTIPLRLSGCPPGYGSGSPLALTTRCSTTHLGFPLPSPPVALFAVVFPPGGAASVACSGSGAEIDLGGVAVTVGSAFGTGSGESRLDCEVFDGSGVSVGRGELLLSVTSTRWPLWHDAIVITATGLTRSALRGGIRNASDSLAATCDNSPGACASLPGSLAPPTALLAAVRTLWDGEPVPPASQSLAAFTMSLTGATRIALRAAAPAFYADTVVSLGPANCTVLAVAADATWLLVETPDSRAVCGAATADAECGYVSLTVANPATGGSIWAPGKSGAVGLVSRNLSAPYSRGAALACPPFCPGLSRGALPAAADGSASPKLAWASVPLPAAAATISAVPALAPVLPSTSDGVYVAGACVTLGAYTDPLLGACANASDPASSSCAFGSGGGACQACPSSSICPGGSRLWPLPGSWISTDTNPGSIKACAPPDPTQRCRGWDIPRGTMTCGAGYVDGSYCACGRVGCGRSGAVSPYLLCTP